MSLRYFDLVLFKSLKKVFINMIISCFLNMVKLTVFIMILLPILPARGLLIKKARDSGYGKERSLLDGDHYVESRKHVTTKDPLGFEEMRGSSIQRSLERDFPPPKLYFSLNMKLDEKLCHSKMNFRCYLARFKNSLKGQYKMNTLSFAYNSKTVKAIHPRIDGLNVQKIQAMNYMARQCMEHKFQKQKGVYKLSTGINNKRVKRNEPGSPEYDYSSIKDNPFIDLKPYSESEGLSSVAKRVGLSEETRLDVQRNRATVRGRYNVFKELTRQRIYLKMYQSTEGPVKMHENPSPDRYAMYDSYRLQRGRHFVGY